MAERFWKEIPNQFLFIELANFVVMPNHVHGILIIDKSKIDIGPVDDVEMRLIASPHHQPIIAPPHHQPIIASPLGSPKGGFGKDKNPMFHKNILRVIRWYKGRGTFEIHKIHADFKWQSLFHDHIIRS